MLGKPTLRAIAPMVKRARAASPTLIVGLLVAIVCGAAGERFDIFTTVLTSAAVAPPAQWNPRFPLSDQHNQGHWVLKPEVSDEFQNRMIDPVKWLTYNPQTGGGFDRSLAAPAADGVDLPMRKGPPLGTHMYRGSVLFSVKKVLYGYLEAEIKVAANYSNNNFFLYARDDQDWTEIDVFEIYPLPLASASIDSMNAHLWYSPTIKTHSEEQTHFVLNGSRFSDAYHVFGFAWTKSMLSWYVDGRLVRQGPNLYWHQPLNISIGSEDSNKNDLLSPAALASAVMKVRYIRVWAPAP